MKRSDRPTFESKLPVIQGILRHVSRHYLLTAEECEELASETNLRLIERWERVCDGVQEASTFDSYLYTTVDRFLKDLWNKKWGKFKTSVTARALGRTAVRLEQLLHRENRTLEEALGILRSAGTRESEAELRDLARRLPPKRVRQRVGLEDIEDRPAPPDADPVELAQDEARALKILATLRALVLALPERDRLILTLCHFSGVTVSELSRRLGLSRKIVDSRLSAVRKSLRGGLEAARIDRLEVCRLLDGGRFPVGPTPRDPGPSRRAIRPPGPSMDR